MVIDVGLSFGCKNPEFVDECCSDIIQPCLKFDQIPITGVFYIKNKILFYAYCISSSDAPPVTGAVYQSGIKMIIGILGEYHSVMADDSYFIRRGNH
jgi:hypothetical protein